MRHKNNQFPNGARVETLVIKDNSILVIHRINHGEEYYVLPGGGWEENETKEEGAKREVFEETSLKVEIERLIFSKDIENNSQRFTFLGKYLGGEPKLGNSSEKMKIETDKEQFYEPMWLPIKDLPNKTFYSVELKSWLLENLNSL